MQPALVIRAFECYIVSGKVQVVGFHCQLHLVSFNRAAEGVRRVAESDGEGDLVAVDFAVKIAGLSFPTDISIVPVSFTPSCLKT